MYPAKAFVLAVPTTSPQRVQGWGTTCQHNKFCLSGCRFDLYFARYCKLALMISVSGTSCIRAGENRYRGLNDRYRGLNDRYRGVINYGTAQTPQLLSHNYRGNHLRYRGVSLPYKHRTKLEHKTTNENPMVLMMLMMMVMVMVTVMVMVMMMRIMMIVMMMVMVVDACLMLSWHP